MDLKTIAIDNWLQALEVERLHQQESFKSILLSKSIKERVKDGFTSYPLTLKSSGFAIGSIPYVVLEKRDVSVSDEKFQAGKPVQIFKSNSSGGSDLAKGIIHWSNKQQYKIYLHTREIPDWLGGSGLGLDLLYDEQTFVDMKEAMKKVRSLSDNKTGFALSEILYNDKPWPEKDIEFGTIVNTALNESQHKAVSKALGCEFLHTVHGPPGTGKTTTLVQLVVELIQNENQILVCAPSNAAVDWIAALIAEKGINVLRLGHLSRMDPEVLACSLEAKVSERPESKEIKKIRIKSEELDRLASQYKRSFGPQELHQRRMLKKESRELRDWAYELERRTVDAIIENAQVICCTLSGTSSKYLKNRSFSTCIIDEAAQALQGACWMAILKAKRVILAGDPFQLPPTVKSMNASKLGLNITLLDLILEKKVPVSLLNVQYRMNEVIMQFSNKWFYEGKLQSHTTNRSHTLLGPDGEEPVLEFIDTAGCGFHETIHSDTKSYYNPEEYVLLREHLDLLLSRFINDSLEIGILSPYKAQVNYMKEQLTADTPASGNFQIQTIDGFQGQEKDVIYISLVRSNEDQAVGFLNDYRRMNVALTRARKKLIIIGDSSTLGADSFYASLLEYIDEKEAYRSAWEFIQTP